MRFLHLADLHIGKRVNEFSMLPDQEFVLEQVVRAARDLQVDAVVVAGDVYDKSVPSTEAMELFERFLLALAKHGVPVIAIPGNHDSAERFEFGSSFMSKSGIHIARAFSAEPQVVRLRDEAGPVDFHLLPFVKPLYVRAAYPDERIETYEDAVAVAIGHMPLDPDVRSVLVAHQFVTNAGRSPSVSGERGADVAVGGVDNVDASLFDRFSYVALGHIHVPQQVRRPEVRYCGSPLAYSFAEAGARKTLVVVDLGPDGRVSVDERPFEPLHAMREVKGAFEQLKAQAAEEGSAAQDYVRVTLTDDFLMDAMAKVREFYPNTMQLEFARASEADAAPTRRPDPSTRTPSELFADFFTLQTGEELSDEQRQVVVWAAGEEGGGAA